MVNSPDRKGLPTWMKSCCLKVNFNWPMAYCKFYYNHWKYFYIDLCVCIHKHMYHGACMKVRGQPSEIQKSVLSLHHVGFRNQLQAMGPVSKHCSPLSHLASPPKTILEEV